MKILKFILLMPLIMLNFAGAPLRAPEEVHFENTNVIEIQRDIPGSGVIHWLAIITVTTPLKGKIKLYVTYFGEEQRFPQVGDICNVDAYEMYYMAGLAADGTSTHDKLLTYPKTMQCSKQTYTYMDADNAHEFGIGK